MGKLWKPRDCLEKLRSMQSHKFFLTLAVAVFGMSGQLRASEPLPNTESETVFIYGTWITGNSFRELNTESQQLYVVGVVEGMILAPFFSKPGAHLEWIGRCTREWSDRQVLAVVHKWMNNNPERWHEAMNVLVWTAMREACP